MSTPRGKKKKPPGAEKDRSRKRIVRTVLVVDDQEIFVDALARALEALHRRVVGATEPARALELAREAQPELAVVDFWMPREDGLAVCRKLKALDPEIYTILLSADLPNAYAFTAGRSRAVDAVLEKGVKAHEILWRAEYERPLDPTSPHRLTYEQIKWNAIGRALTDSNENVTEAAKRLDMHRQSLQKKLRKRRGKI